MASSHLQTLKKWNEFPFQSLWWWWWCSSYLYGWCTTIDNSRCLSCSHRDTGAHVPSSQLRLHCPTPWLTSGWWFTRRECPRSSCSQRRIRCLKYHAHMNLHKLYMYVKNTSHVAFAYMFTGVWHCVLGWGQEDIWGLGGGGGEHRCHPDCHQAQSDDPPRQGNTRVPLQL